MKQTKITRSLVEEIIASGAPTQDDSIEFTSADLMAHGWTRERARAFCAKGMRMQTLTRRQGYSKTSGRWCWLYRKNEKA